MNIFRRNPLTAGRIVDGLAFVVTAKDNKLHTLNTTGTLLWQLAQEPSGVTVELAATTLVNSFQVDREQALADAATCLNGFVATGILVGEPAPS